MAASAVIETRDILATRYVNGAFAILRGYNQAPATEAIRIYARDSVRAYHADFLGRRGVPTAPIEPPDVVYVGIAGAVGGVALFLTLPDTLKRYLGLEDQYA